MSKYTVKSGGNLFCSGLLPDAASLPKRGVERAGFALYFTEESKYELRRPDGALDEDQDDWCKGGGYVFASSIFRLPDPHFNTVMAGYRYKPDVRKFEVNFYNHVKGSTSFGPPRLSVGLREIVFYWIQPDYERDEITAFLWAKGRDVIAETIRFDRLGKWVRKIGPYFGGGDSDGNGIGGKAPEKLSIFKDDIRMWNEYNDPAFDYLP